jgi:hypothetical protein
MLSTMAFANLIRTRHQSLAKPADAVTPPFPPAQVVVVTTCHLTHNCLQQRSGGRAATHKTSASRWHFLKHKRNVDVSCNYTRF